MLLVTRPPIRELTTLPLSEHIPETASRCVIYEVAGQGLASEWGWKGYAWVDVECAVVGICPSRCLGSVNSQEGRLVNLVSCGII